MTHSLRRLTALGAAVLLSLSLASCGQDTPGESSSPEVNRTPYDLTYQDGPEVVTARVVEDKRNRVETFLVETGILSQDDAAQFQEGNLTEKKLRLLINRLNGDKSAPEGGDTEMILQQVAAAALYLLDMPDKNTAQAQEMGLLAGTESATDQPVTGQDALDIFYNLLYMRTADGKLYGVEKGLIDNQTWFENDILVNYPAMPRGGKEDVSPFLQNASSKSSVAFLPPGEYLMEGTLSATGAGIVGTFNSTIVIPTKTGKISVPKNNRESYTLRDFNVVRTSEETSSEPMIHLQDKNNVVIENLSLYNNRSVSPSLLVRDTIPDTVNETFSTNNILINGCYVEDYTRIEVNGIHGQGDGYGLKGSGITLHFASNVLVTNNLVVENQTFFEPSTETLNWQGSGMEIISCRYGAVADNQVINAAQGIDFGGGDNGQMLTPDEGFTGTQYMLARNNTVKNCYSASMKIVNGSSYNIFESNIVDESGLVGIWLSPGTTSVENESIIRNNVVMRNLVTHAGSGSGQGAWSQFGRRPSAISIDMARGDYVRPTGNLVVGNTVTDDRNIMKTGITDYGVFSPDPFPGINNMIIGNNISGAWVKNLVIHEPSNTSDQSLVDENFKETNDPEYRDPAVTGQETENGLYQYENRMGEIMEVDIGGNDGITVLKDMPTVITIPEGAECVFGRHTQEDGAVLYDAYYTLEKPIAEVIAAVKEQTTAWASPQTMEGSAGYAVKCLRDQQKQAVQVFSSEGKTYIRVMTKSAA